MAARNDFKILGFKMSDELKAAYVETYTINNFLDENQTGPKYDLYKQVVSDNLAEFNDVLEIDAKDLSAEANFEAVNDALTSKLPIIDIGDDGDVDDEQLQTVLDYLKIEKSNVGNAEQDKENDYEAINKILKIDADPNFETNIDQINSALQERDDNIQDKLRGLKATEDLMFLHAFEKETLASNSYPRDDEKNISELKKGSDGNLRLIMKNLGGTGLNFTIQDDKSIVFAKDSKLTTEQVKELARFFYIHGIGHDGLDEFKFPNDVQIEPDANNPQPDSLQNTFAMGLQDAAAEDERLHQQELSNDPEYSKWFNSESHEGESEGSSSKPMHPSLSKMADSCRARIGIGLNVRGRLLKSRRALDGSIIFSCYLDEPSLRHDGENNKGDIKRSKLCAFKIDIIKGRPTISCYIPDGKFMEASHAKVMLEVLKSQGAEYFTMPNAVMTSGKGQGAFWEAAGKTLMVPLCCTEDYPEGADIAADHVASMLEVIKKETKLDRNAILEWKRKMLTELREQEASKDKKNNDPIRKEFDAKLAANPDFVNIYKNKYELLSQEDPQIRAAGFVAYAKQAYVNDHSKSYKTNSALQDRMNELDGAIQYDTFKSKYLGTLNEFINKGIQPNDGTSGAQSKKPWDIIEAAAAYRAMAEVTQRFGTDKSLNRFSTTDENFTKVLLRKAMEQEMEIQKERIAKEAQRIGYISANRDIAKQTRAILEGTATAIQENSGAEIKFPGGSGGTSLIKDWDKTYFDEKGKYNDNHQPKKGMTSSLVQKVMAERNRK